MPSQACSKVWRAQLTFSRHPLRFEQAAIQVGNDERFFSMYSVACYWDFPAVASTARRWDCKPVLAVPSLAQILCRKEGAVLAVEAQAVDEVGWARCSEEDAELVYFAIVAIVAAAAHA